MRFDAIWLTVISTLVAVGYTHGQDGDLDFYGSQRTRRSNVIGGNGLFNFRIGKGGNLYAPRSGNEVRIKQGWFGDKTVNLQMGGTQQSCVGGNCPAPPQQRMITRPGTVRSGGTCTQTTCCEPCPGGLWRHPVHGCPPEGKQWVFDCSRCCWYLETIPSE